MTTSATTGHARLLELAERVREFSDGAVPLVLEAFEEGRQAAAAQLSRDLLQFVFERLLVAGRQYETLTPESAAALELTYQGSTHSPVVEAHFGGAAVVLHDLRVEIRRLHNRSPEEN